MDIAWALCDFCIEVVKITQQLQGDCAVSVSSPQGLSKDCPSLSQK